MARTFVDTLKDIREGNLLAELPQHMQDLVAAVRATGKGGKLTLVLTVKPLEKGSNALLVQDDIRVSIPEQPRESTVLFATDTNDLSRRDPRQPDLPGVRGVVTSMPQPVTERAEAQ